MRVSSPPGSGATVLRDAVTVPDAAPGLVRRAAAPFPEVALDAGLPCGAVVPPVVELLEAGVVQAVLVAEIPVGGIASRARKTSIDGGTAGGTAGAPVGDLDGDGADDLLVGTPGLPAGLVVSLAGLAAIGRLDGVPASLLGTSVASLGDADGDGRAHVAAGAPAAGASRGRRSARGSPGPRARTPATRLPRDRRTARGRRPPPPARPAARSPRARRSATSRTRISTATSRTPPSRRRSPRPGTGRSPTGVRAATGRPAGGA